MKYQFNKYYFLLAALLFNAEVLIAGFMHDSFIRPYGGDFLVVILVYSAIKAFFKTDVRITALGVLIFSYVVEVGLYFHLIDKLGWRNSVLARNLLGTTFRWEDILAYTLGMAMVVMVEEGLAARKRTRTQITNG
ncbi:ribosomal maturation YjgA family protein [Mucilaginibacter pedocola]|uniref:DUF2809 domain-containing protein n=1 Tax=Mucilaginibacter pedocola TaxID=1792845 RepID=A0A1S9PAM3_9SPHI|nr:DUF2809 domain-containing protein [Mucilaginibacter pedocola]OOQ58005.1 hypothetical protein BC343_10090 [Mucilaginibacter pedocola]